MHGRIFIEGSVGSDLIVVIGIRTQDTAQMLLAEDDNVVQAFAVSCAEIRNRFAALRTLPCRR